MAAGYARWSWNTSLNTGKDQTVFNHPQLPFRWLVLPLIWTIISRLIRVSITKEKNLLSRTVPPLISIGQVRTTDLVLPIPLPDTRLWNCKAANSVRVNDSLGKRNPLETWDIKLVSNTHTRMFCINLITSQKNCYFH